ncbi:MAG: oligosaccharide flippase family protein [Candidatus Cloacimonetes bacterium]|nr:oligosaccharide flippase family protein [Candidatus Cloacimonadota bacterium]
MMLVRAVGTFAGIIVARVAGPGVVGAVAYGTAYVSVFGFIAGLFGSAHIKLVSEGQDQGKCMAVYSRLQAWSTLLYFLVVLGWFLIQKYILHYPFESREIEIIILISLFTYVFTILEQFSSVVFTANLQQAKANLPHVTKELVWYLGRVVIVLLGYRALHLSLWGLVSILIVVPMIFRLLRNIRRGEFDREIFKKYIALGVPTLLITVIGSITGYAGKLMLAHYTNTTEIGFYTAAFSIGGMLLLISVPVGNIFFPLFSKYTAAGDWDSLNDKIKAYQEIIVIFVFPALCLLSLIGGEFLTLILGAKYGPSVLPFVILMFATYVMLLGMPYGNIISGMGKFYLNALINLIKLAVFFVTLTLLISPKFLGLGATGLAINTLVLNLVVNSLYLYFAKRHGDVRIDKSNHIRHAIIVVVTVGIYFLAKVISLPAIPLAAIQSVVFLAGVYLILFAFGLVKKEHLNVMLEALNFRKTADYVKDELRGQ